MSKTSISKALFLISQYLVALVFVFSGFVKCVDPTGTAIKMEEYFTAFGMDSLIPLSMTLALVMCGAELLIGVSLLLNLRVIWGIWGALALMVFYTPLTLWLALTDKVTDCGCFGDAIKLTNWQTFLKNVVLDLFVLILLLGRKQIRSGLKITYQVAGIAAFAVFVAVFEWYNVSHLPVIDFMPYKKGTHIPSRMIIPDGALQPRHKITFIYEKNGRRKRFSSENLPDSTWIFVDRKDRLLRKGYEPPIHDFSIITPDNQDVTTQILEYPDSVYLLVISSIEKTNTKYFEQINRIAQSAWSQGYDFYALTSSLPEEHEIFRERVKASYPIYMMDETTLKTMIRSNPGLLLIKEGTVLGKWHFRDLKKVLTR